MNSTIYQYIEDHTSAEPPHLAALYRRTQVERLYPRMCTDHVQGRLLKMLTAMIDPRRVIELGTFTGYSTLCIAEGMRPGGEVHTVEIDDEYVDQLTELFESSPGGEMITLHTGDALELIERISTEAWDMAFVDANKRHYRDYLELLIPRMRPGGFILADNTLWGDKVVLDPLPHDAQSLAIMDFNDFVAHDLRVEAVMLPVRDGLTLLRVKP